MWNRDWKRLELPTRYEVNQSVVWTVIALIGAALFFAITVILDQAQHITDLEEKARQSCELRRPHGVVLGARDDGGTVRCFYRADKTPIALM